MSKTVGKFGNFKIESVKKTLIFKKISINAINITFYNQNSWKIRKF